MPEAPPRLKVRLPPETVQRLKDLEADFKAAWGDLEALKKIGLDTALMEDKLRWAEEARKVLLERFA